MSAATLATSLPWIPPDDPVSPCEPDGSPVEPPASAPTLRPQPAPAAGPTERKRALEDLLRARRLQADGPPLRGEDARRPAATGVAALDAILAGGFPRGELSEIHGPASSGRTGVLLSLLARATATGALAALVDPLDRLDPVSAAAAGVELERLLWLRGPRIGGEEPGFAALAKATAAVATLVGSGLFDVVALDLAGAGREPFRLPSSTWLRLERLAENTKTALVLLADGHVACGPGGRSLALEPGAMRFSGGARGPACLLTALVTRARAGRHGQARAELTLAAV